MAIIFACLLQFRSDILWVKVLTIPSCNGIQDSLGFWIPRRGFQIPGTGFWILCQWNLDSGFQSFVRSGFFEMHGFQSPGFRIPLCGFQIPGTGFWSFCQWNLDSGFQSFVRLGFFEVHGFQSPRFPISDSGFHNVQNWMWVFHRGFLTRLRLVLFNGSFQ